MYSDSDSEMDENEYRQIRIEQDNARRSKQWQNEHQGQVWDTESLAVLGPSKAMPHYGNEIKSGEFSGYFRSNDSQNGMITPLPRVGDDGAPENYTDKLVCRHLAIGYLVGKHPRDFIDEVVNSEKIQEYFANGEGLKYFDDRLSSTLNQDSSTKQFVTNHGFGRYLADTIDEMVRRGAEEEKVYISADFNHAMALWLRRKNEENRDRVTVYAYDPNVTGNHVKIQALTSDARQHLQSTTMMDLFPSVVVSQRNPFADTTSAVLTSLNGQQLRPPEDLAYVAERDILPQTANRQLTLAMRHNLPDVVRKLSENPTVSEVMMWSQQPSTGPNSQEKSSAEFTSASLSPSTTTPTSVPTHAAESSGSMATPQQVASPQENGGQQAGQPQQALAPAISPQVVPLAAPVPGATGTDPNALRAAAQAVQPTVPMPAGVNGSSPESYYGRPLSVTGQGGDFYGYTLSPTTNEPRKRGGR